MSAEIYSPSDFVQGLDILSKEPKGVDSVDLVCFLILSFISAFFLFSINSGKERSRCH